MTRLNEVKNDKTAQTHLLLIGPTKSGKSTYSAQAVKDGFTMMYVDADNGISALKKNLADDAEAMSRVLYFGTEKIYDFVHDLLESKVFRWNLTQDKQYSSASGKEGDEIVEIVPSLIPTGLILNIDSWSSIALDAMEVGAGNKSISLEELLGNNKAQGVYGEANMRLNLIAAILQRAKFRVIVQAHSTFYERFSKPKGVMREIKQGDMILEETLEIPLSSSKPHGHTMGKYFNEIGWMEIDRANRHTIDFKAKFGRVGGGTPNKSGTVEQLTYASTFGPATPVSIDESWIRYMTHEEFVAKREAAKAQSKPTGVNSAGQLPKSPVNQKVNQLLKR